MEIAAHPDEKGGLRGPRQTVVFSCLEFLCGQYKRGMVVCEGTELAKPHSPPTR